MIFWYICEIEYYSPLSKNETRKTADKWMDFEHTLSKITQSKKEKMNIFLHMQGHIYKYIYIWVYCNVKKREQEAAMRR